MGKRRGAKWKEWRGIFEDEAKQVSAGFGDWSSVQLSNGRNYWFAAREAKVHWCSES